MQKTRTLFAQEVLDALRVKIQLGNIDPVAWKLVGQFRREFWPNEGHAYSYLLQHADFTVTQNENPAKLKYLRAH